ncbi:hypothetical protein FKP32DRAFT_1606920 [Trametes sanguinea]|nr:hypothetical protein FKP32DRAFT_1606920 [Trametes sanguinea]
MLDKVNGGCSVWLNFDGRVPPGQAIDLENLQIDVHATGHVTAEIRDVERPIAEIIQKFAETMALPTAHRWARALQNAGIKLDDEHSDATRNRPTSRGPLPFLPEPQEGTTHYICWGRPVGEIDRMVAPVLGCGASVCYDGPQGQEGAVTSQSPEDSELHSGDHSSNEPPKTVESLERRIANLIETLQERDEEIDKLEMSLEDQQHENEQMSRELGAVRLRLARAEEVLKVVYRNRKKGNKDVGGTRRLPEGVW